MSEVRHTSHDPHAPPWTFGVNMDETQRRIDQYLEQGQLHAALQLCEELELNRGINNGANNPVTTTTEETQGADGGRRKGIGARLSSIQMALYLVVGDLCGARHFWRRLPADGSKEDPDTVRLWRVGQALWRKDSVSCVATLTEESWTDDLVPLVKLLQERFRESQLRLIGSTYKTVRLNRLAALLGASEKDALEVANQCGWGWDGELVHPKTTPGDGMTNFTFLNSSDGTEPSPPSGNVQETDEVRLERINGYISLLSNLQQ